MNKKNFSENCNLSSYTTIKEGGVAEYFDEPRSIKEFAEELSKADVIYVTSIYGAGEVNEDKITSKVITDLIYNKNKNVNYINNYYEVTKDFYELTQKGDLILNMGAGDCHNFWSILNEKNN